MSWAVLDDQMTFNPKIVAAGNEATGAWVRMIAYCAAHLTDGFVPESIAEAITSKQMLQQMLKQCFVHVRDGGYVVHDYLEFNKSAEFVKKKRAIRASAGKKGGKKSGEIRREANCQAKGEANASANAQAKTKHSPLSSSGSEEDLSRARVKDPAQTWLDHTDTWPGAGLSEALALSRTTATAKGQLPDEYLVRALKAFSEWVDGCRPERRPQKSPHKFVEHFARVQEILEGKRPAVTPESVSPPRQESSRPDPPTFAEAFRGKLP